MLYVTGNFFAELAMAITNSKEMKGWLASEEVRGQDKGVLVLLERVVWDVTHSSRKCKLSNDVLSLSEVGLDQLVLL